MAVIARVLIGPFIIILSALIHATLALFRRAKTRRALLGSGNAGYPVAADPGRLLASHCRGYVAEADPTCSLGSFRAPALGAFAAAAGGA
jgi:hypothetical protein